MVRHPAGREVSADLVVEKGDEVLLIRARGDFTLAETEAR